MTKGPVQQVDECVIHGNTQTAVGSVLSLPGVAEDREDSTGDVPGLGRCEAEHGWVGGKDNTESYPLKNRFNSHTHV